MLDPASSEMWQNGNYVLFKSDKRKKSSDEMVDALVFLGPPVSSGLN